MIAKKNKKADLERKRFAFFQIGLLVTGSLCLAAFEYSTGHADEQFVQIDPNQGMIIPDYEEEYDVIIKEEVKAITVRTENPEDIEVVEKMEKQGTVITSDKGEFIQVEGGETGDFVFDFVEEEDLTIHEAVDEEPSFPGGDVALMKWMQQNVNYPDMAAEMGIQGMVYVKFVVNKDGSVSNPIIVKSVHDDLDAEAVRVVGKMPNWNPGEQAGKKVRVYYTIPINFVLR